MMYVVFPSFFGLGLQDGRFQPLGPVVEMRLAASVVMIGCHRKVCVCQDSI